jgi:hypothetical protein
MHHNLTPVPGYGVNALVSLPPAALPFLFPGSRVPVKIGTIPNAVVIDWEAAAAEDRR